MVRLQCFVVFVIFLSVSVCTVALEVEVIQRNGEPLVGAIVSLHGENLDPPGAEAIELVQQDKRFDPQLTIVPAGSVVNFKNKDDITHHVYSFSKAWKKQFRLSKEESREEIFIKPGEVVLGCNIHDWMLAYLYIMDTPYFGISDDKGLVRFSDVVEKELILKVRHPRIRDGRGTIEKPIVLGEQPRYKIRLAKKLLPKRNQLPDDEQGYIH